jgi:hypothetical protein
VNLFHQEVVNIHIHGRMAYSFSVSTVVYWIIEKSSFWSWFFIQKNMPILDKIMSILVSSSELHLGVLILIVRGRYHLSAQFQDSVPSHSWPIQSPQVWDWATDRKVNSTEHRAMVHN